MSNPLSQRIVPFEGDELIGVQNTDGAVYAVFSRLCDNLTVNREGQVRRIRAHAVMNTALVPLTVETLGGTQQVLCLKLSMIPLWLSSLQANRIKDEQIRVKLVRYQHDAADVLWQAFKPQIINEDQATELATSTDAELAQLAQIAEMGRAIVRMAEEQIELRRRMDTAARAFGGMRKDIADVQVRLGVLEDKLSPAAYISEAQAAEVSSQVKALAQLLTAKDASKNHYQSIFGEIYRRYGVSSYKLIRREQYEAVIAFLEEWRTSAGAA
jgi:hypothetical protein